MAKSQSKYSVCAKLMNEALVALLEKKDFDYITIKEICKKAGVNRSTFYLHYENIYDLLQEVINGLNTQFIKEFNKKELSENIGSLPVDKLIFITTEYITPYLNFIKDNLKIFKVIYKNPALFKVEENYYVTDILSIEERNIIAQGMVYYWIESKANYNKLMKNQINTKDFNQLSNANVLLRLNELLDFYRREFNRLRKAYTKNYDGFNGWS